MENASQAFLFEVNTPLGVRVRVTHSYWELISTIKHPVIAGHKNAVMNTLKDPDEIRMSRRDPTVYLFYKSQHAGRWVCAVAKQLNGEGFSVMAYPTDAIKEGKRIWHK